MTAGQYVRRTKVYSILVKAFDGNEGYVKGEKLDELEEAADEYV